MLLLIFAFSFFIFLFCLYNLSRDDYLFLRKDISLNTIFDFAFILTAVSIFFARFFYVIFNYSQNFLNPLAFALFPYFPGLSFAGAVFGLFFGSMILAKVSKVFSYRIFDFLMLSMLCALPFGFAMQSTFDLITKKIGYIHLLQVIIFTGLFVLLNRVRRNSKYSDGSLGFLILGLISSVSLIFAVIEKWKVFSLFALKDNLFFIIIFLISIFIFLKQEKWTSVKK